MYIKKQIELNNTGHINYYWEVDFKQTNLTNLPMIQATMLGWKNKEAKDEGKAHSDNRYVTVTATDLELQGSIGYNNIPKLYEVLTTKTVKTDVYNPETGETEVQTLPVYLDFYTGEIVI